MPDHQYLNPAFALPRFGSTFFAGSAFYVGFVDPFVRESLRNPRQQLTHWGSMYKYSSMVMPLIALGTSLSALRAYQISKEPLWVIGSLAMFSVVPYTYIFLGKLIKDLKHEDKYTGAEIDVRMRDEILGKMKKWLNGHRVRILIALLSTFIFYVAEG